ncbi:MAG: PaaI family thioesterase [Chitinispirillaceae bacterium]|nr:PaaI family thioesterase [Chitinispirillaceae bacterium]
MRSLTADSLPEDTFAVEKRSAGPSRDRAKYDRMLLQMKRTHHIGCLFNRSTSVIPDIPVRFDDTGTLHSEFTATEEQQGYDGRMHGGVVAALIDASMAQCLMGHGVCGYTVDLTVKYRQPVMLHKPTRIAVRITGTALGDCIYEMKCELHQGRVLVAGANGRFYRKKKS